MHSEFEFILAIVNEIYCALCKSIKKDLVKTERNIEKRHTKKPYCNRETLLIWKPILSKRIPWIKIMSLVKLICISKFTISTIYILSLSLSKYIYIIYRYIYVYIYIYIYIYIHTYTLQCLNSKFHTVYGAAFQLYRIIFSQHHMANTLEKISRWYFDNLDT